MATKVRQSNLDNTVITGNTELTATAADDDVLIDRRAAQKTSEPEIREQIIKNLKNWNNDN